MKPVLCALCTLLLLLLPLSAVAGGGDAALPVAAPYVSGGKTASLLLMDAGSGQVLVSENADAPVSPASVTKIMTLLLTLEAISAGQFGFDTAVVCSPHASSMGGSQIWLAPGESMTVDELLRATAIASANDASVALGETVAGSEEAFVALMNQRAGELGMTGTTFKNATGLDEEGHVTTAADVAKMSRALLRQPEIVRYSTVWMDSLRDGATQLVNTNRLVRFYKGTTGLKTGTTNDAGYCLSASALRDGLHLIAVVMDAPSSELRFSEAQKLLDYGFAQYASVTPPDVSAELAPVRVVGGQAGWVTPICRAPASVLIERSQKGQLKRELSLSESATAPVEAGEVLGEVRLLDSAGALVCAYPIEAAQGVPALDLPSALSLLWQAAARMGGQAG